MSLSKYDPMQDLETVAKAINEAFARAYPPDPGGVLSQPTMDCDVLVKRVKMLIDDLECTRINWHNAEKNYSNLDRKIRGIRNYWWQFWRRARYSDG
jgi:hypothetical protein